MDEITDFYSHYRGCFYGILQWSQLDELWTQVKQQPSEWYIYFVGGEVPVHVATSETLVLFVQGIDQLLRTDHQYDYCGIVYVDDMQQPKMIKIFDPNQLGTSCSMSGKTIFSRWILTQITPQFVDESTPIPANRQRWWQRFFPAHSVL